MSYDAIMLIIFGVVILVVGLIFMLTSKKGAKKEVKSAMPAEHTNAPASKGKKTETTSAYKKNADANVNKDDIFNFMEFDKIQDNMIIQQKGEKYTAVIKCKGINYNLMSEVEQLSVEEGFMTFLNTLKFPIQLYVQAQTVNLKSNIQEYKENMKGIHEEFDETNMEYNTLLNSLESTDEEIQDAEDKKNSILNVLEYGQDIVRYVERLAVNKSMLQRSFYVLVSYYKSELTNASNFNKEELLDICYSELFTRVQSIMSGLSMCSVTAEILKSNDIAELLYSAYNRDDKNNMSVQQALEAGFYRLYSTSEDAVTKKHKKLLETIKQEAEYKAVVALNKAIDEGTLTTQADIEDSFDQETSKQAIEIVKRERVSDKIKQNAKQIIVDEYKKNKKARLEKQEKEIESAREQLKKVKEKAGDTEELVLEEKNGTIEQPIVEEIKENELNDEVTTVQDVVNEDTNVTDDDTIV